MSRRVLLVCYYFPPLGMGGIGRPLNLFQELPNVGWDCDILTVKPVAYRGFEPELLELLDQSRIFRSGSYDPQRILYLLGARKIKAATIEKTRAASARFFPDSKIGWVGPAIRRGRKLLRDRPYSVIMSTSPPISCHLVARQLALEFAIPWAADFRDYWSVTPIEQTYHDPRQIERGNRLLDDFRNTATLKTAVNQSVADYVGTCEVVRNAYNEQLAELWKAPSDNSIFRIGLVGHDIDQKSWQWLLDVLSVAQKLDPQLLSRTELIHVGQADASAMQSDMSDRQLSCRLSSRGHLSRKQTFTALSETHMVYVGMFQPEGLQFVPGKIYDLLVSGRPILSNVKPTTELAQIITTTGNGWCYTDSEIDKASTKLIAIGRTVIEGNEIVIPRPSYALQHGSRRQAETFARLFEKLV